MPVTATGGIAAGGLPRLATREELLTKEKQEYASKRASAGAYGGGRAPENDAIPARATILDDLQRLHQEVEDLVGTVHGLADQLKPLLGVMEPEGEVGDGPADRSAISGAIRVIRARILQLRQFVLLLGQAVEL
jgi:hypothetical protein